MVMMPYNSTWRNIRKLMHQVALLKKRLTSDLDVERSGQVSAHHGEGECAACLGLLHESQRMVPPQRAVLSQCHFECGIWREKGEDG